MEIRWLFLLGWLVLGGIGSAAYYLYLERNMKTLKENKIHEIEINDYPRVKLKTDIIDVSKFYNRAILFIGTLVASMLCAALAVGVHVSIDSPTSVESPIHIIIGIFILLLIFFPISAVAFPTGLIYIIEQLTQIKSVYAPYFVWEIYACILLAGIFINDRSVMRLLLWVFVVLLIINIGGCAIVTPSLLKGLQ